MELGSLLPSKRKALFQRLPFVPSPDVGGGGTGVPVFPPQAPSRGYPDWGVWSVAFAVCGVTEPMQ